MSLTGKALEHIDSSMQQDHDFSGYRRRRTEEWFDRVLPADQHDSTRAVGVICQMYSCICAFYDDLLNKVAEPNVQEAGNLGKPLYRLLDSIFDDLVEWGDDFKVWNGNLDETLKDSQDLRNFTIKIMMRICETLINDLLPAMAQVLEAASQGDSVQTLRSKAKEIKLIRDEASLHAHSLPGSDDRLGITEPTDSSASPSVQSDTSSLADVLEDLKTNVEALIELAPCFEDPIADTLVTESAVGPSQLAANDTKYQTFLDGINQKYPTCDPGLALALSKALYDSTVRLHAERQAASEALTKSGPIKGGLPKDSGYETSLRDASQQQTMVPRDDSISGGTSTYARTLASIDDGDDGVTRTPFPSQPKGLKVGDKFPCIACGRPVSKSERASAWRRHLLSDLRPWICCQVSCDCARVPYRTKNEWLVHLQAQHEVHPHWSDKKCPFCPCVVEAGGRDMIRHVERHLKQLSLAALPANPGDDDGESESDREKDAPQSLGDAGKETQQDYQAAAIAEESLEDHPLYKTAQGEDGLWHCPWEGEGNCEHKPSVLRADFDKYLKIHLDSQRCKVPGCKDSGRAFATLEILHLHEQAEHGLHKGGGRFLCTSPGCGRSRPGNGFASPWVQLEHIKSVHENISGLPPLPKDA
ncbi:hypothetical protein QBC34DRAFT_57509 [Podospora aff. communis PSN243]|uniref:C2H2-type domain-containing protein n=1 Tax=Podospora aff. communis PSN243 TaxID=3040156 RepID=A0AAV9GTE9_9PEZI|nr:hypothetical protein QBC34DRAFT_57509 [Podospora aff. communis PSN243]